MDGNGKALDNIFIELFCRALKYELIYLNSANERLEIYEELENILGFPILKDGIQA
jgi:putative transposase